MRCKACSKPLVRRVGEYPSSFKLRRHCNVACGAITRRGQGSGYAILKEHQVKEIKAALAEGRPAREIAQAFGVAEGTIRNIQYGETWRHVD